jgi:hypothetical protein
MPIIGIWQRTPGVDMTAHFIDDRRGIVLLFLGREPLAFIENECILFGGLFPFLRFWDRRDEIGAAQNFENSLRGLPVRIQLPVSRRTLIRRIQDRVVKDWI